MLTPIQEQVIKLLQEDGRQSAEVLARKLNVHPTTIRRTIRKLTATGAIRILALADPEKVGLTVSAVFALDVDINKLEAIMDVLSEYPEVQSMSASTGRYDLIVQGRFPSNDCLLEFAESCLGKLDGVRDIETFVCFRFGKGEWTWVY